MYSCSGAEEYPKSSGLPELLIFSECIPLLLLRCVEGVDRTTHADEVRHLLEVQRNRSDLHRALLADLGDDLLLAQRALLQKDALDDIGDRSGLVAPFTQSIETA